jgi:hypothetical protein
MYPDFLLGAPPTPACAAFIKESRMKCANARMLDRKSGVRPGEHGAPVQGGGPRCLLKRLFVAEGFSGISAHRSTRRNERRGKSDQA